MHRDGLVNRDLPAAFRCVLKRLRKLRLFLRSDPPKLRKSAGTHAEGHRCPFHAEGEARRAADESLTVVRHVWLMRARHRVAQRSGRCSPRRRLRGAPPPCRGQAGRIAPTPPAPPGAGVRQHPSPSASRASDAARPPPLGSFARTPPPYAPPANWPLMTQSRPRANPRLAAPEYDDPARNCLRSNRPAASPAAARTPQHPAQRRWRATHSSSAGCGRTRASTPAAPASAAPGSSSRAGATSHGSSRPCDRCRPGPSCQRRRCRPSHLACRRQAGR